MMFPDRLIAIGILLAEQRLAAAEHAVLELAELVELFHRLAGFRIRQIAAAAGAAELQHRRGRDFFRLLRLRTVEHAFREIADDAGRSSCRRGRSSAHHRAGRGSARSCADGAANRNRPARRRCRAGNYQSCPACLRAAGASEKFRRDIRAAHQRNFVALHDLHDFLRSCRGALIDGMTGSRGCYHAARGLSARRPACSAYAEKKGVLRFRSTPRIPIALDFCGVRQGRRMCRGSLHIRRMAVTPTVE